MSDEYPVGYGKPPVEHRFKAGNQAARGKKKRQQTISLPEILGLALKRRRRIKRGDQIVLMPVDEIMIERVVQMMTTGSSRDLITILTLIERVAPQLLEQQVAALTVTYHQAQGSSVSLPPAELWRGVKDED